MELADIIILLSSCSFIGLFITAIHTDLQRREIPDWISICLILIGASTLIISGDMTGLVIGALMALIVYVLGFFAYKLKLVGGGDVKLWSAGSIAMGALSPAFIAYMGIYGFGLAIIGILCQKFAHKKGWRPVSSDITPMPKNIIHNLSAPDLPYGLAIAFAGIHLSISKIINISGGLI